MLHQQPAKGKLLVVAVGVVQAEDVLEEPKEAVVQAEDVLEAPKEMEEAVPAEVALEVPKEMEVAEQAKVDLDVCRARRSRVMRVPQKQWFNGCT